MRIIAFSTLRAYAARHADAKPPLSHWHAVMKDAVFGSMSDIQTAFPKAKVLNADRVRFPIGGGRQRLIVAFDFERQIAFIKFLGTHEEYDAIDALTVSRFWEPAMDVRPIRTDADLTEALQEIHRLWGAPVGTPEGDKLDVLATLADAYERAQHPVPESDPVEILHFAIGEMGRSQAELAELLGSRSHASEILNRKRPLSLEQIRRIAAAWRLPIAALARPYRLERDAARAAPHSEKINTR